jgi:hypothetical protein
MPAADHLDPLAHAGQAEVALAEQTAGRDRVEADPVVVDAQPHRAVLGRQRDRDPGGAGVLAHVVEGLLGDPVQHRLQVGGEPALEAGRDGAGHPAGRLEGPHLVVQGHLQALLVEHGRAQLGHEPAQAGDAGGQLVLELGEHALGQLGLATLDASASGSGSLRSAWTSTKRVSPARAAELTSRPSARPASTCARVLPVPQPRSTTRSPGRAASSPASQRCRLGTTGSTIVSTSSGSPAMGGT